MRSCRGSGPRRHMGGSGSSTTSLRTSRTSSTSDGPTDARDPGQTGDVAVGRDGGRGLRRAVGYLRLVHPYPSTLDAVVTGILAAIAGGAPVVALRLAV